MSQPQMSLIHNDQCEEKELFSVRMAVTQIFGAVFVGFLSQYLHMNDWCRKLYIDILAQIDVQRAAHTKR
jgi:hypothetical protein